ncbi:hypothetical protein BV25DRAFT_1825936, partial [Artomyces pyxidatus]
MHSSTVALIAIALAVGASAAPINPQQDTLTVDAKPLSDTNPESLSPLILRILGEDRKRDMEERTIFKFGPGPETDIKSFPSEVLKLIKGGDKRDIEERTIFRFGPGPETDIKAFPSEVLKLIKGDRKRDIEERTIRLGHGPVSSHILKLFQPSRRDGDEL